MNAFCVEALMKDSNFDPGSSKIPEMPLAGIFLTWNGSLSLF